jgi:DNA primase
MLQEIPVSFAYDVAKERIRESVDIAEVIGSYIELRRQGRALRGICPWHDDSKPSLVVTPERQIWRCFVCHIGGDIFSFVMQYEGVEFFDALRMLADKAGIELPKTSSGRGASEPGARDKKSSLLQIMKWAEKRFHDMLINGAEASTAREYLAERGINSESVQRYRIGFSPRSWTWLLDLARERQISNASLTEAGLIGRSERGSYYDRFRGRIIFPIRDLQERPIAFGGRILPQWADDGAKYVNSPETPLFKKRSQLYGLNEVRDELAKTRSVTVMEGYTDVVMARQLGVRDAVAVLGTALGEDHVRLLRRFVDQVVLVLDGDEAGRKRANDVLALFLTQGLDLRVLTLPDELDPCDFIAQRGVAGFDELRHAAPDALQHLLQTELAGFDPLRDTHKASRALDNMLTAIASVPRANSEQQSKEMMVLGQLARTFQLHENDIRARLTWIRKRSQTKKWVAEPVEDDDKASVVSASERELLEVLLLAPELADVVAKNVEVAQFTHTGCREILQLIFNLQADGRIPDFMTMLTMLETKEGKSLLVEIDHKARDKAETVAVSPADRWKAWHEEIVHARARVDDEQKRKTLKTHLNETEALDVIKGLLANRRARMKKPNTEEWD